MINEITRPTQANPGGSRLPWQPPERLLPVFSGDCQSRWMLVDDNPDFLKTLSMTLGALTTVTVECHDSPAAALAAFTAAPGHYDLVITDYEMPGMNGEEFCRRLHAVAPRQKIFLATGSGLFTDWMVRAAGFSALLRKPFSLATLSQALAAAGLRSEAVCTA